MSDMALLELINETYNRVFNEWSEGYSFLTLEERDELEVPMCVLEALSDLRFEMILKVTAYVRDTYANELAQTEVLR